MSRFRRGIFNNHVHVSPLRWVVGVTIPEPSWPLFTIHLGPLSIAFGHWGKP